ncbi:MAG: hypothetical protein ACE5Q6_23295 [Dehalococcoidia bacterium]
MEQTQPTEQSQRHVAHCHWHPGVETGSCSRCSKPVCAQCMVQAPVGIRCRECGKAAPMPTYNVSTSYYARAIGVAAGVAIGGGILWVIFNLIFGGIPFASSLVGVGIGYAAGELISRSVNRKRGTGLAWIAGGSVVVAFLIAWQLSPFFFSLWGLLLLIFGVFVAVQRVRR